MSPVSDRYYEALSMLMASLRETAAEYDLPVKEVTIDLLYLSVGDEIVTQMIDPSCSIHHQRGMDGRGFLIGFPILATPLNACINHWHESQVHNPFGRMSASPTVGR